MERRTLIAVGILIVGIVALLLSSQHVQSAQSPEKIVENYRGKWGYKLAANKAAICDTFSSPSEAIQAFQLHVNLALCKENKRRTIGFIEEENLYGFLTCIELSKNNYFCCAEISTTPTRSFIDWKNRCT